jgi:VCBS repeat-containing protein
VTLNGTAEANSTVRVFDGTTQIGTATTNARGAWTYTADNLDNGTHSFTSRAVDAAGNTSNASAAMRVNVDTHSEAPDLAFTSVWQRTSDRVSLQGTADANDRVTIYDNNGGTAVGTTTTGSDGRWTLTTSSPLSDDVVHRFTATVTDNTGRTTSTSTAILGTSGDDRLVGTSGDDLFRGNGGHDTFTFAANFGHDVIADFGAGRRGADVVEFSRSVFDNFADVLAHATQHGQDVVIDAGGGSTLTLQNTSLSSLDRSDFHFV